MSTPKIDLAQVRAETPGCEQVVHFNNAGAALMPQPVIDAVLDHLALEARIGGYEAAERASERLQHTYDAVAALVGAGSDEIALMDSATRAWDIVFHSLRFQPGDRVLTSNTEYASNYIAMLQVARRTGVAIDVIGDDRHGQVDVAALEAAIDERVKLIALTHVPSTGGLVNPAAAVGKIARSHGVPYLLDACQSVGQIAIDVGDIGCDFLSGAGRKYVRGPRGTGFLYARRDTTGGVEPVMLDMHGAEWTTRDSFQARADAGRFETFEYDVAGRVGLGVACDYAAALGVEAIEARVSRLAAELRARLRDTPGVEVRDRGERLCGIVTFTVAGRDSEEVRNRLYDQGINTWISAMSHSRLDLEPRGLAKLVRASVHYYNSEDEVDRFATAVSSLASPVSGRVE
ncbi:MAG TPA: aminotransferase class V-fold PLP-dependent enzyme [Candidatus Solibacter sp.]|nr:aminotransferase class V-fold PLP-dependent enzyme [Candidatus Solibacter sp.]